MPQWKTKHRCLGKCGDAPNSSHLRLIEIIPQFWRGAAVPYLSAEFQRKKASPKSRFVSKIHPSSHRSGNLELLANWIWRPDFCLQQSSYHTVACCTEEAAKWTDRKWHVEPWLWLPSRISVMKMFLSEPWVTLFQIWKGPPDPSLLLIKKKKKKPPGFVNKVLNSPSMLVLKTLTSSRMVYSSYITEPSPVPQDAHDLWLVATLGKCFVCQSLTLPLSWFVCKELVCGITTHLPGVSTPLFDILSPTASVQNPHHASWLLDWCT